MDEARNEMNEQRVLNKLQKEIHNQYPTITEAHLGIWGNFPLNVTKPHYFWPNVFYLRDETSFCLFRKDDGWYIALIDNSFPQVNEPKHTLKSKQDLLRDITYQVLIPFTFLSAQDVNWCQKQLSKWTGYLELMGVDMSF